MTYYQDGMVDSPDDVIRKLVADKIGQRGLKMNDISMRLGKNSSYIHQYLNKKSPRFLPEDVRPELAALLEVDETDLVRKRTVNQPAKSAAPHGTKVPYAGDGDRITVYGMAECGPDGHSLWNGEAVATVPRPPTLTGVPNAYAVYAVGDSMENRYYAGEVVYIHPGKPVTPGCYVLVQLRPRQDGDAPRAFLKRMVRRSGDKVVFEQFNPAKTFTIKLEDIVTMDRVVGSGEA